MRPLVWPAVLLAAAATAGAATAAAPGAYALCLRKARTTLETSGCNAVELRRVERILDGTYRRLVAGLSPTRRQLLAAAEARWVAFRDRECDFAASQAAGGTLEPILHLACRIRLTVERTAHLERHLRP